MGKLEMMIDDGLRTQGSRFHGICYCFEGCSTRCRSCAIFRVSYVKLSMTLKFISGVFYSQELQRPRYLTTAHPHCILLGLKERATVIGALKLHPINSSEIYHLRKHPTMTLTHVRSPLRRSKHANVFIYQTGKRSWSLHGNKGEGRRCKTYIP